jgi:hypothetical protein
MLPIINDPPNVPAFTQEINDNVSNTSEGLPNFSSVIASLPSTEMNTNFVLSPDSDHGSVQSAPVSFPSRIRPLGPVSVDHLKWKAAVYGEGDFPRTFDCLLDNGAHLVLIRPEVVKSLKLKIQKLDNPELVSLALQQNTSVAAFTDFVSLSLSSLNNAWSSLPIRAILAKDLCTDILLGLPFLKHNKIVIDHDLKLPYINLRDLTFLMKILSLRTVPPIRSPRINVVNYYSNNVKISFPNLKLPAPNDLNN